MADKDSTLVPLEPCLSELSPLCDLTITVDLGEISVAEVARYLGGSGYQPSPKVVERILDGIKRACRLADPKAAGRLIPVANVLPGEALVLKDGSKITLPACCKASGAEYVAVTIGTLGERIEEECRSLAQQGKVFESTVVDAVGTVMLDKMSHRISYHIGMLCDKEGLSRGARFAPGINDYPLEEQGVLFSLAGPDNCGVTLNSASIMIPTKSVSFYSLLSRGEPDVLDGEHKCSECQLEQCQFRMDSDGLESAGKIHSC